MNSPEQTLSSGLSAEPLTARPEWTASRTRASFRTYGLVAWGLLTTLAFGQPLARMTVHVVESNLHSYVLIVPLVVAYLLYLRKNEFATTGRSSAAMAMTLIGAAVAVIFAGVTARGQMSSHDFLTSTTLAYVIVIEAGGFLFFGSRWMASVAFPMAFLFFLVPLPDRSVDILERASVVASTEVAAALFKTFGIPFLRDGTVFSLPTITIKVAQECSGIRSSWVLLISSLLAANIFLKHSWRRAVLVAFVIPLGVLRNGFRILTLGMLCVHVGPQMLDTPLHHYGGPLFFTISLIPLFLLMRQLARPEQRW
jgi:exosortase C (VPDSG-CTERM-specific)